MIFDGHIHIKTKEIKSEELIKNLKLSGIGGALIISLPPASHKPTAYPYTYLERIDNLLGWTSSYPKLFPFFWIDPVAENAVEQVEQAVDKGIMGFKVICSSFYPGDHRAMKTYKAIALARKPILFHSGIQWDGKPSSSFNKPSEFEVLVEIDGLNFSLAHISWPWCDENIAVYGKFLNAYSSRPGLSIEMFIDITPGTPPVYRDEVLTKLLTVGYDVTDNIIFGTDCAAEKYNVKWATEWINRDNGIYNRLGFGQDALEKIYSGNLKRFLGIKEKIERKIPIPGS